MGKKLEKLKQGQATKYLSRNQAIKKLQISLKQFRKLCILKGIYPVEPLNNKIKKKSTKLATYYLKKDILMLQWEPLLKQFRIQDALARKGSFANQLLKLDHVIKERYPKFEDALKDLDDSLSLIAMFSTLNSDVISDGIFG